jgi:hypothetical protein
VREKRIREREKASGRREKDSAHVLTQEQGDKREA